MAMNGEPSPAARWDKRYRAATAPLFGEAPNEYLRMVCARSDFAARSVLCLADGDGRNGCWLAARGLAVTALDVPAVDRKTGVWGKGVSGRVDPGGRRSIKKKT